MDKAKTHRIDLVEQARQLRLQAEELERKVQRELARGTQRNVKPTLPVIANPSRPFYVGDETSTRDLMAVVQRMLEQRPWRFIEIVEETGARDNRIKGVITQLQREGVRVVDVAPEGTGKALWFIPSPEVLARLKRAAARK